MAETLKQALNASNPGTLADNLRALGLGDLIRMSMVQAIRGATPATSTSQLSTVAQVGVDKLGGCAAVQILAAYSRGATNTGALTVVANGTTPATGQIAVAPNGDIVVLAADARTLLDVDFLCMKGDYLSVTGLPVASNKALIPAAYTTQGVLMLLSGTSLTGTNTGSFVVVAVGGTPTAKQVCLDATKSNIVFAAADAVTSCSAELLLCSAKAADSLLKGQSIGI